VGPEEGAFKTVALSSLVLTLHTDVLPGVCVCLQLFGFAYLTWWELSWDVMEPVAYFVSLTYSLIAYMYFLITRGSYFEQKEFKEYCESAAVTISI
jgi:hypothetical protein